MRKVNAETLEAFREIKNELLHRITAQEEKSMEQMQQLEETGASWREKANNFWKSENKEWRKKR